VARKKEDEEKDEFTYAAAKDAYKELGRLLYGLGGGDDASRKERRTWKYDRRMLEHSYPKIRDEEEDDYRETAPLRRPGIRRLTIELDADTGSGVLTYPDGSRRMNKQIPFASTDGLRQILAKMIVENKVDPAVTEVVVGRSAQRLATLIASLG